MWNHEYVWHQLCCNKSNKDMANLHKQLVLDCNPKCNLFYSTAQAVNIYTVVIMLEDFFFSQFTKLLINLFGVLRRFQHCTGHITKGSWKGRGNQYIQFVRVLYCKLPTNGKQLPVFPLEAVPGIEPRPQRWEARVLPLCHRGPLQN